MLLPKVRNRPAVVPALLPNLARRSGPLAGVGTLKNLDFTVFFDHCCSQLLGLPAQLRHSLFDGGQDGFVRKRAEVALEG